VIGLAVALALTCASHNPAAERVVAAQPRSVRAGRVVFGGLRDAETRRFGGGAVRFRSIIGVRRGAAVSVAVAKRDRGWVSLEYGPVRNDGRRLRVSDGHVRQRFVPCAAPLTAWTGGFIVGRRGCASLLVGARVVRVGFGRRC
jgi:hypothetical protein